MTPRRLRLQPRRHTRPLALALGAAAVAAAAAPAAGAVTVTSLPKPPPAVSEVAPGVTYQRVVRPGGVVLHVVRTRPGAATLSPFMPGGNTRTPGDLQAGTAARLTSVASVNGDFFNLQNGYPSGITVIGNRLISEPEASRSALVMAADGRLEAGRFTFAGAWQTINPDGSPLGTLRRFPGLNRPGERANESLLYTPDYAGPTPTGGSRNEAVVRLDPGIPGIAATGSVTGTVVSTSDGGGVTPPADGVVLTGLGANRAQIVSDLATGQRVRIDTTTGGFPAGAQAIGGGPLLVDGGAAVPSAGEGFSPSQTDQRTSRTAVGQSPDGGYVLVTAEGPGQNGPGISVAEQAALMASLGARLAVAMDAGGSAQMVVGGAPVVAWSSPRRVTTAVAVDVGGVRIAPLPERLSPNRDRVDDTADADIVVPRPGVLSVALVRRGASTATPLLRQPVAAGTTRLTVDPRNSQMKDGPYRLVAELTPADGSAATHADRPMVFDSTLGSLKVRPFRLKAGRRTARPSVSIDFTLTRRANVTVRIENSAGKRVRTLRAGRSMKAGRQRLVWDRFVGRKVAQGSVRITVIARSSMGTPGLTAALTLPPAKKG